MTSVNGKTTTTTQKFIHQKSDQNPNNMQNSDHFWIGSTKLSEKPPKHLPAYAHSNQIHFVIWVKSWWDLVHGKCAGLIQYQFPALWSQFWLSSPTTSVRRSIVTLWVFAFGWRYPAYILTRLKGSCSPPMAKRLDDVQKVRFPNPSRWQSFNALYPHLE